MEKTDKSAYSEDLTSGLVQAYLDYLRDTRNRSAMTLASYTKDLSQFLVFLSSLSEAAADCDARIVGLDRNTAQQFVDCLMARSFSVATVGRKVAAVRGFYKYLIRTGRCQANPFAMSYVPQRDVPQVEYLSAAQLNQLLAAIDGDSRLGCRDRAMVALLYNTGMRVSELLALTPAAFDLEQGTVTICTRGHKMRVCRLAGWVVGAIRKYLDERDLRGFYDAVKTDRMFLNRRGETLTGRSIRRKLSGYSRLAGLPVDVGPAVLRHSCAMHLLLDGADAKTVRDQLGHLSASSVRPYLDSLARRQAPVEPAAQVVGV
jgi:site-specific recombinase XerD